MSSIIIKISQLDPRIIRLGMFIVVGLLAPIIVNSPGLPGGISGQ